MKLKLIRYASNSDSSGGLLLTNGVFTCFTCEDEHRDIKVPGETRIPAGEYYIKLRDEGGMTRRYAARYPFHRGMLHLQDVPGFEWVYIHVGNSDDDSLGCILVGLVASHLNQENMVSYSSVAYTDLYRSILAAVAAGETVTIEISDLEAE